MDHSHHSHGGGMEMPMPGHGGHEGMSDMCNMNMLFTWDTTNLCIVFRSWRVTGIWSLLFSLLAIVVLTAGYEAVREGSRRYEARVVARLGSVPRDEAFHDDLPSSAPDHVYDERSLLLGTTGAAVPAEEQRAKVIKAIYYAVQVFYSFFIMLLFMTYNGWVMLSVAVGAFIGFLLFGDGTAAKTAACH